MAAFKIRKVYFGPPFFFLSFFFGIFLLNHTSWTKLTHIIHFQEQPNLTFCRTAQVSPAVLLLIYVFRQQKKTLSTQSISLP